MEVHDATTTTGPGPDAAGRAARRRLWVLRVDGTKRPDRVRDADVGPRILILDGVNVLHGVDCLNVLRVLDVLDVLHIGGCPDR